MNPDPSTPSRRDLSCPTEYDLIASYRDTPVRILMLDGLPWFALSDICQAAGYHPRAADAVDAKDFPKEAKRTISEEAGDGSSRQVELLTSVGVWWLTALNNPGRGQGVAAWARREALKLCPEHAPKDPALFLTLKPDGELPPRPMRYSGRLAEWEELRFSREYMNRAVDSRVALQARLLREAEAARLAQENAA
jgi:hypothetical protein